MENRNKALVSKILTGWNELKNSNSDLNYFISRLETTSNNGIVLLGGVVRDWWLGYHHKDIDIVIDSEYYEQLFDGLNLSISSQFNKFDGTVINIGGQRFDIWKLEETYAFKQKQFEVSFENLVLSVPLSTDSIAVSLNGKVYEHSFWNSIDSKRISIVNKVNIDQQLNIISKAKKASNKYNFELDEELKLFCEENEKVGCFGSMKMDESISDRAVGSSPVRGQSKRIRVGAERYKNYR